MEKLKSRAIVASILALATLFLPTYAVCKSGLVLNKQRTIKVRGDGSYILFQISGNYVCPVSPEGPFPEWHQSVWLRFVDLNALFSYNKSEFKYPKDFSWNFLREGVVKTDINRKTVTLNLQFAEHYGHADPVNGEYSLLDLE